MDKKKRKVYTPAEKRRRNRRHNAIVTSIAVVLMLAGIIIIVSDTTFFFDDAERWIRRNIFGEVFETIPPFPTDHLILSRIFLLLHNSYKSSDFYKSRRNSL